MKTSSVPAKDPYFATLKSTNYLVNTLCLMDAEADNVDQGIFLDSDGNIAEGPNMNVAIITADGTFVVRSSRHPGTGRPLLRKFMHAEKDFRKLDDLATYRHLGECSERSRTLCSASHRPPIMLYNVLKLQ